jgi:hypothetical protein
VYKKVLALIAVVVVIASLLVFTLTRIGTINDMMKPPKLYGENAQMQHAFENSIKNKNEIILKYPTQGDYRSSFVLLDMVDGKWENVANISGYGNEVISVEFEDINNDGINEIFISWQLYESKNKVVSIHNAESSGERLSGLSIIANETYSFMKLLDLDNDGQTELFITNFDISTDQPRAYAKLFKMDRENRVKVIGEVGLDNSISDYPAFKVESDNHGNISYIFIDANKGEFGMITEVVYWDSGISNLKAPFLDSDTLTNIITQRTPAIASMDIDDDGYIEIPKESDSLNISSLNSPADNEIGIGITTWYSVVNDLLVPKKHSFVNFNDLYILGIDDGKLKDSLLAYRNLKQRKLTVHSKGKDGKRLGELFSIITVAIGEWAENPAEGYSLLSRNDNIIYAYRITDLGSRSGVTSDMLSRNLKVIK